MEKDGSSSVGNRPAEALFGHGLAIRREGCKVLITLIAQTEYGAIELLDRLIKGADEGTLRLNVAQHRP